jgi:hypothetical protein
VSAEGGGGGWFVLGLGVVGALGGGYALARSMRPARAHAEGGELSPAPVAPPASVAPKPAASAAPAVPPWPASQPAPPAVPPRPAPQPGKPGPAAGPAPAWVPPLVRWTGPMVPAVPADAPRGPLTRSTVGQRGAVREAPEALLAQARAAARDPSITLDELAGARLAASEYGGGSLVELAAIIDAEANRAQAAGRSLFDSLTRGAGFGRQGQGSKRPASTRLDPEFRHLWAARAVLVGMARGIARGAVAFFNPAAMDATHAAWKAGRGSIPTSCDALGLLELWSFDRPRLGDAGCPFDSTKTGTVTRAWVGPIEDVDPWRLMLLKPAKTGAEHFGAYVAASKEIAKGRALVAATQKGTV